VAVPEYFNANVKPLQTSWFWPLSVSLIGADAVFVPPPAGTVMSGVPDKLASPRSNVHAAGTVVVTVVSIAADSDNTEIGTCSGL
jgi:hypothetical protein